MYVQYAKDLERAKKIIKNANSAKMATSMNSEKQRFNTRLGDLERLDNGSFRSENGRIIWDSWEAYVESLQTDIEKNSK
jgi:hypothetical protein